MTALRWDWNLIRTSGCPRWYNRSVGLSPDGEQALKALYASQPLSPVGLSCNPTLGSVNRGKVGGYVICALRIHWTSSILTAYEYFCNTCSYQSCHCTKKNPSLPWLFAMIHKYMRLYFPVGQEKMQVQVGNSMSQGMEESQPQCVCVMDSRVIWLECGWGAWSDPFV